MQADFTKSAVDKSSGITNRQAAPAQAGPRYSRCFGILHRDQYGIRFGGSRNEGEGVCIIDKSQEKKVLAICSVEHYCEAKGLVDYCKDAGECVQITGITSVVAGR